MALNRALLSLLLLFLIALSLPCSAQIQPSVQDQSSVNPRTRSVEGIVVDKSGTPVPRAVVLLKDTKTLQVRSFIAQDGGKYHFFGLSPDVNYEVRAESLDMTSPTKHISVFDSHGQITVNLKLKKKKKD